MIIFIQIQLFPKNYFRITGVSNHLDPDQAKGFVKPDLDSNCLQRLSADDTRRQRVEVSMSTHVFSNLLNKLTKR